MVLADKQVVADNVFEIVERLELVDLLLCFFAQSIAAVGREEIVDVRTYNEAALFQGDRAPR